MTAVLCPVCGKMVVGLRQTEARDVVRIEEGSLSQEDEVTEFTGKPGTVKYVHRRPCYLALTQSPELLEPEG